ncbi:hypothetical protein BDZ85DRAFT_281153 [Elsinoe ampelina]|uniref:Uncharacterized protein n=1 Tax=Elsinoe ampelina TaxID=302913 RepID=A0A6A6GFT8_9PEZI|nr:hypothetical protein BDZ85DRAFT_281153 [Elsinoe ampelina]
MLNGVLLSRPIGLRALCNRPAWAAARPAAVAVRYSFTTSIERADSLRKDASLLSGPKYPSSLNVFHLGVGFTTYIGMCKMSTIFFFAYQCLVRAPALAIDETAAFFWTPLTTVIYALPMIAFHLITSPVTASINVLIPPEARQSPKTLQEWAVKAPRDTLVEFTTLRFLPFPKRKTVKLEDLKLLRPGPWWRIAQFAYLPPKFRATHEGKPVSLLKSWIAGCRTFYVREGSKYTRTTRGPTVWAALVDGIMRDAGLQVLQEDLPKTKAAPRPAARRTPPGQTR